MEKKFAVVLVALLLSVFLVSAAEYSVNAVSSADDWPMFNHDAAHSSYSSGPVPTNPTLLWTFPNPNITAINLEDINYLIATPAVSNGYLYTSGINNTSNLYCLNASTGKLIWVSPEKGINSPSSPAVVNGMVYMGTINLMSAFNASTGELIWNASAKEDNDGYTPAVADGVVYVEGSSALYALNASTGAQIWSYPLQGPFRIAPAVADGVVCAYDGGKFIQGYIFALNASTGQKMWNYTMGRSGNPSSPTIVNGIAYIGSADHQFFAFNALTGALMWNRTLGREVWCTPAVAYGMVYVGSGDKNMYAFNASTGDIIWSYPTGEAIHSSAAVADGVVYVGSDDRYLYSLNASSGELLWKYLTISPSDVNATYNNMNVSPAIADGNIYMGTCEGNVIAFGDSSNTVSSSTPSPTVPELILLVVLPLIAIIVLVAIAYIWTKRKNAQIARG